MNNIKYSPNPNFLRLSLIFIWTATNDRDEMFFIFLIFCKLLIQQISCENGLNNVTFTLKIGFKHDRLPKVDHEDKTFNLSIIIHLESPSTIGRFQ